MFLDGNHIGLTLANRCRSADFHSGGAVIVKAHHLAFV
jgi:hypothetical protein